MKEALLYTFPCKQQFIVPIDNGSLGARGLLLERRGPLNLSVDYTLVHV